MACHQFHFLERIDVLAVGRAGGDVPAEQPLRPGRGLGPPAGRSAAADHRQEAEVLRGRCLSRGPRSGHGRPDQHDHADLLLRAGRRAAARRGDRRRSRTRSRRPTASGGETIVEQNYAAVGRALGGAARGEVPRTGHVRSCIGCRRCRRTPPDFVETRDGDDDRRPRATCCRSARCRSTARSPPARRSTRSGASPWRSRSGIRRSASSAACARWSARMRRFA